MRTWVKLYTEILRDPKMHKLPDRRFRICVNLIALAGLVDKNGMLGTLSDVAFHLRTNEETTKKELEELQKVVVTREKNGVWYLKNWNKRQSKPPSDDPNRINDRVKKYREKKAKQEHGKRNGNGVTPSLPDGVTLPEIDTEIDTESEVDSDESVSADAPHPQHELWVISKDIFQIAVKEDDEFISSLVNLEPQCTEDNAREFVDWFLRIYLQKKPSHQKAMPTKNQITQLWGQAFKSMSGPNYDSYLKYVSVTPDL